MPVCMNVITKVNGYVQCIIYKFSFSHEVRNAPTIKTLHKPLFNKLIVSFSIFIIVQSLYIVLLLLCTCQLKTHKKHLSLFNWFSEK